MENTFSIISVCIVYSSSWFIYLTVKHSFYLKQSKFSMLYLSTSINNTISVNKLNGNMDHIQESVQPRLITFPGLLIELNKVISTIYVI